jgi:catechol 2,3-dioxygenase-like lactoylglutathione lyase family enzyme
MRLHHVSIAVTDMDRALRFWIDIFGFRLRHRFRLEALQGDGAFVAGAGTEIELWCLDATRPVPDERRAPNTDLLTAGTKHVAFLVPDLLATLDRLAGYDIPIVGVQRVRGDKMRPAADVLSGGERRAFAAFIHDPFGTLIELLDATAGDEE